MTFPMLFCILHYSLMLRRRGFLVGRSRRDRSKHHEANDGGLGETALPKDCQKTGYRVTSVIHLWLRAFGPVAGLETCGAAELRDITYATG
jgi:hypothetical protein